MTPRNIMLLIPNFGFWRSATSIPLPQCGAHALGLRCDRVRLQQELTGKKQDTLQRLLTGRTESLRPAVATDNFTDHDLASQVYVRYVVLHDAAAK